VALTLRANDDRRDEEIMRETEVLVFRVYCSIPFFEGGFVSTE
jgi:hypothetical protein